ncbi:MAG: hypothetical protein KDA58_02390 [Planctomycetaceae bacterium]|nr:hypothetical protein [Planctomycetaceae bacterium]
MDESTPRFQFRVLQGQTDFPVRPLSGNRFVIGGGSHCQLQLGGEMPIVHTVLSWTGTEWQIEAVVPWPLLMVNHQQVRTLTLRTHDVVEIGDFRFRFEERVAAVLPVGVPHAEQHADPVPVADVLSEEPHALEAAELTERLSVAMDELELLESRRRDGWQNLLAAAFAAQEDADAVAEPMAPVQPQMPASEHIAEPPTAAADEGQTQRWQHLEAALWQLTQQVQGLHDRESALVNNAQQMEQQHAELLERIEAIRAELAGKLPPEAGPGPKLKISA